MGKHSKKQDRRLNYAIRQKIQDIQEQGDFDEDDEPTEHDAIDALLSECGMMADSYCTLAGTEHCDWDCPFSS